MIRSPGALVLVAAVLGVSACGGEEEGRSAYDRDGGDFCSRVQARVDSFMATVPDTVEGERYGGTTVVGGYGEIADGMNALVSADYTARQHQSFVNLMTLLQYDRDLEPRPYLAESWEISEDETELTFHLRDDVRWHDGERTDAYDVRFTYLRATDPATGFPNAQYWTYYEGGEAGVEVLDSLTVRFHLQPHSELLDPWRATPIMPEHLLADVAPEELRRHPYGTGCPVGNGPFVFVDHRQDERWTFRANPAFPEELGGRPYLDRYVYRIILEQTTLLTELVTGGVDAYIALRPDQADRVGRADDLELLAYPFRQYTFVGWNSRIPELESPLVRRALTRATNRREIVNAIRRGYGTVANTTVPPFHWAYDPSFRDAMAYDPDRARELLDEAGWVDRDGDGIRENASGVPLEITLRYNTGAQERQQIAEIMQAQLGEVGIRVRPQSVEYATLIGQVTDPEERDFEGVVLGFVADFRLDDTQLFHSEAADEAFGIAGLDVPAVDHILDTLQLIPDREEARPLWHRYQELIVEHQPFTFFYFVDRIDGVNRRVRNVEMDVRGEWINIARWWIPAEERKYAGDSGP